MIKNFHNNVEMLLERMQKVSGQGKHIAMDATVQVCVQLGRVGMKGGRRGKGDQEGLSLRGCVRISFHIPCCLIPQKIFRRDAN